MSKTIWKTELLIIDEQTVHLPEGFEPLSLQLQGRNPCLWFVVDTKKERRNYTVRCYGTGHPLKHDADTTEYLGTVQFHNGELVFHFFVERV